MMPTEIIIYIMKADSLLWVKCRQLSRTLCAYVDATADKKSDIWGLLLQGDLASIVSRPNMTAALEDHPCAMDIIVSPCAAWTGMPSASVNWARRMLKALLRDSFGGFLGELGDKIDKLPDAQYDLDRAVITHCASTANLRLFSAIERVSRVDCWDAYRHLEDAWLIKMAIIRIETGLESASKYPSAQVVDGKVVSWRHLHSLPCAPQDYANFGGYLFSVDDELPARAAEGLREFYLECYRAYLRRLHKK